MPDYSFTDFTGLGPVPVLRSVYSALTSRTTCLARKKYRPTFTGLAAARFGLRHSGVFIREDQPLKARSALTKIVHESGNRTTTADSLTKCTRMHQIIY